MTRYRTRGRVTATALIVVAAFCAAVGLWLGGKFLAPREPPAFAGGVFYPTPRAVPAFALAQANGKPLTEADWRGRWTVAFFGYTTCPDVCPTTLAAFKSAWAELGKRGVTDRVRIDFISVDPERDKPEALAQYVGFFSPDFVAATGSDEELTKLTHALGLIYTRTPTENGDYTVDHSASAVIIDPAGREVGLFRPPFDAKTLADDLTRLAKDGG